MSGHELDDPSTMTKKPELGLDYMPRKSDMTFWSRYDAVRNAGGPTDHWTKMKVRAVDRVQSAYPGSVSGFYFDQSLSNRFEVAPGSYHLTRPRTVKQYQDSLRSSFNLRAKEGFQYWLIEKPKPTTFGRYGIGSCKTVLGVGNAPRT